MVKRWNIRLFVACMIIVCDSCSTYDLGGMLAAGSSVQERFRNSMNPPDSHSHPEKVINNQSGYHFLVATDLHIKTGDWEKLSSLLTETSNDKYLLMMFLGDYMHEAGSSLNRFADSINSRPELQVMTAIGNHEVYKKGYQNAYRPALGATCYCFKVKTGTTYDLFIILDSANGTLGIDQFKWLQSVLSEERRSSRHCFVFTHANFFSPPGYVDVISTYPIEEQMKLLDVFAKHHVNAVFTGHSHYRDETTVRGVKYITIEAWNKSKKGEYCRVECQSDGKLSFNFK